MVLAFGVRRQVPGTLPVSNTQIKVINQLGSGFAFSVILRARLSDGFDDQLSEREAER
jgi:hypothetical protein